GPSHPTATQIAIHDDAPTLDSDPGAEFVNESNRPGAHQRRNVSELLAGRVVVVHRTDIERQAHNAGDRFRRNPRDRSDGRLDAHGHSLLYVNAYRYSEGTGRLGSRRPCPPARPRAGQHPRTLVAASLDRSAPTGSNRPRASS